jgi:hypothetical protein
MHQSKKMVCICLQCRRLYSTWRLRAILGSKFCSKACHRHYDAVSRRASMHLLCVCEHCHAFFIATRKRAKKGYAVFCSASCRTKHGGVGDKRKASTRARDCLCPQCGRMFRRDRGTFARTRGRCCSRRCSIRFHNNDQRHTWLAIESDVNNIIERMQICHTHNQKTRLLQDIRRVAQKTSRHGQIATPCPSSLLAKVSALSTILSNSVCA